MHRKPQGKHLYRQLINKYSPVSPRARGAGAAFHEGNAASRDARTGEKGKRAVSWGLYSPIPALAAKCSSTLCNPHHKSSRGRQSAAIFPSDSPCQALWLRRAAKPALSSWLSHPRLRPASPPRQLRYCRAATWGRDNSAVNQIYCKKPNL